MGQPDGTLTHTDEAVAAILRYMTHRHPETFRGVSIGDHCTLSLRLKASALLQAKLFAEGSAVRELNLSDGSTSEVDIDMTTYATRQAIKKGRAAFGPEAQLSYASTAQSEPGVRLPGDGQHPFAFLQEIHFQVESSSPELQRLVEGCLNDVDPTTLELRGRLGAQAVKSVFNQKEVTKETWVALGLSLAASGGIAVALDIFAWGAVLSQLSSRYGANDPRTRFAAVMLPSITPALAETSDAFFVGRLIEKLRGGSFMPESLSDAWDTLVDSMKSGVIAAVGSVGNNALDLTKKWAFQPLNFLTNQVAVATSGAMVPIEVAKALDQMAAGVIQQMNNRFFPVPEQLHSAGTTAAQQHKAFVKQIKQATEPALDVAPGDGLAINSMGIGSLVSQLTFVPIDALARMGRLDDVVKSIVGIVTNTPTEVISTTIGSVTSRQLGGLGNAMTTDAQKDRLMVALIADKTLERLKAPDANDPAASVEITEAELQAIEHPSLELTFKAGKAITKTMNGAVDLIANVVGVLRGRPPQTLSEKVDIAPLSQQAPSLLRPEV